MKNKALFLDRDGVILEMYYNRERGTIDTPLTPKQISFVPHVFSFLKKAKKLEFLLIVVSNQPGIGLKKLSKKNFDAIEKKIHTTLALHNIQLDKTFYCFHHPFAKIQKYKKSCDCRKPKTKLIQDAIVEFDIDVKNSWFIGDSIFDIVAGNKMKLKTMLLARINEAEYLHVLEKQLGDIQPTVLVNNLQEALEILKK